MRGGHGVHCARGSAWYPLPMLAQHLGGLSSCLSLCPRFHFAGPPALLPFTDPRVNRVTFHLFFHVSLQSPPCPLPAGCAHFGSCNHTHFQIPLDGYKCSLSIKQMKGTQKREEKNTEGSEKAKEKRRMRTNVLARSSHLFFFPPLFMRSNNVCVYLRKWTSEPILSIAYKKHKLIPLRTYSKMITCQLVLSVCASAFGDGCQPSSNKKSWHNTTSMLMLILDHRTLYGERG